MDGRWRVQRGAPFEGRLRAGCDSWTVARAGGAAARGWWHALNNQIPDAEVVVLAQIAADGRSLDPVSHVAPKVEAIVEDGIKADGHPAFDTIVVVGDDSRREAERHPGVNATRIRVVRLD